ncbi:glycosyltransferase family 4 protein [Curtobacterium sp. MCBA15_004]|uniref:glycosyltransferase family 4 protein n=1 Tax=unclassified Curtobacterium TaxID=257496 RepID=UPI0008DD0581|nr:glycosyltransferase family 4 protein [Curtobacterium sp. MCBA15_004]WIA95580.1 glycosyltransferase family 4 protein [Curtobacterium sp. MCBA15_004]
MTHRPSPSPARSASPGSSPAASAAPGPSPAAPGRALRIGGLVSGLALTGGLERCVLEDARALVAAGHTVELWHRDSTAARAGEGRAAYDGLGVRLLEATDPRFGIRTALRDALRFAREGLRLRRAGYDVLWLNRPEYLPYGRVVSAVSGIPLAVHLHHAPNYRRLGPIAGGRSRFLAVSHAMARAWAAAGTPVDKITVVPNGVDTDAFPPATTEQAADARRTLGIDTDRPVVLYYGRLSRSKGVVALLEAWQLVLADAARRSAAAPVAVAASSGPAAHDAAVPASSVPLLVLTGALYPEERGPVGRAVDALPAGSVLVLPERDDVLPLLHAADLVVAPSIEPEGFGRTVVEAMSAGVPAVAAASGGTAEVLADEWERFTVDPTDTAALARTVTAALDEATTDPTLPARCRAWVRERYDRAPHERALLDALVTHAR